MALSAAPAKITVLVVDDEPLLLLLAVEAVERAGSEAVTARNADEAIDILENRNDIRIVFTDVNMPGSLDGMRLAAVVRDRWPPVEIIVTSAHLEVDESDLPERSVFFSKPYDPSKVIAQIQVMAQDRYHS